MSFKYCRAYSWPNSEDNWSLSKMYFEKMAENAKELELKLPCDFIIFLAYEEKEFPFVSIALDMDYHAVADTEISQILDDFKSKLGEPMPTSVENPGWYASVDSNYKSTLVSYGITLCEGEFYKNSGTPLTNQDSGQLTETKPSESDIQNLISETLSDSLFTEIDLGSELRGKSLEWQLGLLSGWSEEKVDEVKKLIAEGAQINSSKADTYPHGPPLYFASYKGHLEIVKVLLNNGADPNLPDSFGDTPLIAASDEGHSGIVKILLNNGADINLQGMGQTALAKASYAGHLDIVKNLLDHGADALLHGSSAYPPLALAAMQGNNEIVIELLARGAHLGEAGQSGREALLKAKENGHEKTASLIKEKVEDSNSGASATTRPPKIWWKFWSS